MGFQIVEALYDAFVFPWTEASRWFQSAPLQPHQVPSLVDECPVMSGKVEVEPRESCRDVLSDRSIPECQLNCLIIGRPWSRRERQSLSAGRGGSPDSLAKAQFGWHLSCENLDASMSAAV